LVSGTVVFHPAEAAPTQTSAQAAASAKTSLFINVLPFFEGPILRLFFCAGVENRIPG
jgi:hypothetical protein